MPATRMPSATPSDLPAAAHRGGFPDGGRAMQDDRSLETLLAPLGDDAPAGPDLEYDPEFLRLERESAIRAERALGESVIAAEEPDWDKVQALALELPGCACAACPAGPMRWH
ncbi:hypothetical protein FLG15_20490 [Xanthomonas phaseoli pv. dieffenbachiae]